MGDDEKDRMVEKGIKIAEVKVAYNNHFRLIEVLGVTSFCAAQDPAGNKIQVENLVIVSAAIPMLREALEEAERYCKRNDLLADALSFRAEDGADKFKPPINPASMN